MSEPYNLFDERARQAIGRAEQIVRASNDPARLPAGVKAMSTDTFALIVGAVILEEAIRDLIREMRSARSWGPHE